MNKAVRPATPADHDQVRAHFRAYQTWLKKDICFKDFEAELADLSGIYQPPKGGLWVAEQDGEIIGTVALRPLSTGSAELRRLWVIEKGRGQGLGVALTQAAIGGARAGGYSRIDLDTFAFMPAALKIYAAVGFKPCENPYHDERIFMRLELEA